MMAWTNSSDGGPNINSHGRGAEAFLRVRLGADDLHREFGLKRIGWVEGRFGMAYMDEGCQSMGRLVIYGLVMLTSIGGEDAARYLAAG
jgi:hypothetical protein